jgi:DNA-directed RNA polymerase specialized sigma24 family protein
MPATNQHSPLGARQSEVSKVYAMHSSPTAHTSSTTPAKREIRSRVYEQRSSDCEAGYELFRRAILARDEDAWIEIGTRYRAMLIAWAGQSSVMGSIDEGCEDVADRALARAWSALSPERFTSFPNLAALMGYLRTCVSATAIDMARARAVRERAYQKLDPVVTATPEQVVIEEIERVDLWRAVLGAIACEQERTVLIESFQLNLPPRAILARHPDLFGDVGDVYMAKRHLIGRLQRDPNVRRFECNQFAG